MIKNFKHKGIEKLFTTGSSKGINAQHKRKIEECLRALDTAVEVLDMDISGWYLHKLKGDKERMWSIRISGNWRIIFEFVLHSAYDVDYKDYHK